MRKPTLGVALFFALILVPCAPLRAAQQDPYAIFANARSYFEHQAYPPYLQYDVAVDVVDAGKERIERYQEAYNAVTDALWLDPISDYELAHPASGRGVRFCGPACDNKPQPAPNQDFLGVPELAPTYSFTIAPFVAAAPPHVPTSAEIVAAVRVQFHDPNPHAAKPSPSAVPSPGSTLHEIAAVTVYKRDYEITLAGEDVVNAHTCYHLQLTPVHTDGRYRLRELWIDDATYATIRAKIALNFVVGPGTLVPWTIDFDDVGGVHYIGEERADAPVSYARHKYTSVRIAFENIHAVATPVTSRDLPYSTFLILQEPENKSETKEGNGTSTSYSSGSPPWHAGKWRNWQTRWI